MERVCKKVVDNYPVGSESEVYVGKTNNIRAGLSIMTALYRSTIITFRFIMVHKLSVAVILRYLRH